MKKLHNIFQKAFAGSLLLVALSATAQQQFIVEGKIEFERKTNQHAFLDENNMWDEMAKKDLPKFVTYYQDLYFKGNRTLYRVGREPDQVQRKSWSVLDPDEVIASNLDSGSAISQKSFFMDTYLVSDYIRKIDWKISPEIRKIAGFDCRKATGKVLDSIVVIAFYTDEIVTSGGPESFTGLPGMILGIAIPRMHTTWYATKLSLVEVTDKDLVAPKKGKKMTGAVYSAEVKNILKRWGDEAVKRTYQFLL